MSNTMNWEEVLKKNLEYLDKIDFLPYLERCKDLNQLRKEVKFRYDETDFTDNNVLDGCVFNWLDSYDLQTYLSNRYPEYLFMEDECYESSIYIMKRLLSRENNI